MKFSCADFQRLWNYSTGFYAVWVAHIGRQTGLFAQLANSPATVDTLTAATRLHRPAVQAWCSASHAYGFVIKRNGKLYLTRKMRSMLLDKKNPKYLGGQFSYLALRSLEYDGFDDLFKHGKTRDMTSTFDAIQQATDWDHYAFITAIKRSRKELHLLLSKGCRLLDVGCGTGSFLAKLQIEYPKSSLVGIDPSDEAVKRATRMVESKCIAIMKQDGESMQFSDEFHVVYLGESLYATRDKQKVVLNCYNALKKGGIVAITEGLLPCKQTSEYKLILGMQLDFALQGYQFMTSKEVTKLLQTTGFSRIKYIHLGGSVYLVTARK